MKRSASKPEEKAELNMTAMIDIVFQLLIFFIMSFKIVSPEGDFNIRMPPSGRRSAEDVQESLPILVRLQADSNGNLSKVSAGPNSFGGSTEGINRLKTYVRSQLGNAGEIAAKATEIELDCDYNLKYKNVIDVISACTGYRDKDGKIIKLAEKIRFRAPRG